jgi:hypothetical protein
MKFFTGWQYLLIDAASQFGLDKLRFEERLEWAQAHLNDLEALADKAEEPALYRKAVMAIRKAQRGLPTGHMVGLDASCSGIQVMSTITGCVRGAQATGLIDPDRRADAYSEVTQSMSQILGQGVNVSRSDAKKALMTSFYGSKRQPKDIFGEGTVELKAFYQAATEIAPGAWDLLQVLLASWQPWALSHQWQLPDGYEAKVKVMKKVSARIEVEELAGASFTYEFYENEGEKKGLSNVANVTHSLDAYVLRSMHRRCNYDRPLVERCADLIQAELIARHLGEERNPCRPEGKAGYYWEQYHRSGMVDTVILPHFTAENLEQLTTEHLHALFRLCQGMLQYQPFPLVTVHDEFKCHPNKANWMRWQYREILADLAESNVLDDILTQIYGCPVQYDKLSFNLGDQIKQSNYAIC